MTSLIVASLTPQPEPAASHGWMRAWIYVVPHPWFAVSDEKGAFRIAAIPPGDHGNGIVNHVFGDIHVESISDACDGATYLALVTRSGAEPIDPTKIQ